ncbi:MAG: homoserine dehydrogenase [Firmicutes bacterium]|nr:homoserine dehydrogenase [Bacillota bacterium]
MNIALLGAGTVGGSLLEILSRDRERIAGVNGAPVTITKVLEPDRSKHERIRAYGASIAATLDDITGDPSVEVVVELIGRIDPSREMVLRSLEAGKHVVTANKDLISEHLDEFLEVASRRNVAILFEASVCGAIPIIKTLANHLRSNRIDRIAGIVNGTTNYILTKMAETGASLEDALKEAQRLGYAESDPTADVRGLDAARKICILARLAYGVPARPGGISVEGIENVTAGDISAGKATGMVLKILAVAARQDGGDGVEVRVHPAYVPATHQLASVTDSFNAVEIRGFPMDNLFFVGRGAGGMPTASAIVGDLLEIQRARESAAVSSLNDYGISRLLRPEELRSRWLVRGRPGAGGGVAKVLRSCGMALERTVVVDPATGEVAAFTGAVLDQEMNRCMERLAAQGFSGARALRYLT